MKILDLIEKSKSECGYEDQLENLKHQVKVYDREGGYFNVGKTWMPIGQYDYYYVVEQEKMKKSHKDPITVNVKKWGEDGSLTEKGEQSTGDRLNQLWELKNRWIKKYENTDLTYLLSEIKA